MGLSASMWTSVSGLMAHGNKMNVVGNNIANVSTIGFKGQRMDFNDYLYINGGSTSGPTQIGAGVSTYAVIGDFSQGSLESTNSVTDIAIDGNGFFKVRQPNTDQMYYTRAGDFYFNANRELQNPEGYKLQGWKVDNSTRLTFKNDSINLGENTKNESVFQGTGTPVDIVLDSWYLEPQRTSSISFTMGLTSDNNSDRSTSTSSPMTALFDQWDATKKPPMADTSYATSSSIKVFDEGGTPHTLTVYYDQVSTKSSNYELQGLPAGYTMYEYVVTIPPEEDMRTYGGRGYDPETSEWATDPKSLYNPDPDVCNKNAGMLMTGHLIFDAAGNMVNQTAYTYGGATTDMGDNNQYNGDPADLSSWQSTRFSSNGLPVFTANFTGQPLANTVNETTSNGKSQAQEYIIELDLGLRNLGGKTSDWTEGPNSLADLTGTTTTTTEKIYKTAPSTGSEYTVGEGIYYHYDAATKSYNPVKVEYTTDPTTKEKTLKLTDTKTSEALASDTRLYTKSMKDGTRLTLDKITDPSFTPTAGATFTLSYLGTNPPSEIPAQITKNEQTGENQIIVAQYDPATGAVKKDASGSILWEANPVKSSEFMKTDSGDKKGTQKYAYYIEQQVPTYPTASPDPVYAEDVLSSVMYRNSEGNYVAAYEKDKDGKFQLKDAARGQSLYVESSEVVEHTTINYNNVPKFAEAQRGENASSAGTSSFVTQDAGQNGYASGVLSGTNITNDGVVYGYYDNGETVPLYQIALYDFHNEQGLRREGGNLYAQTKESGEARQGVAGENGFGQTRAYNIEQSNVDLSREFVNMITTQRGFQANSKGITTVDTMLETVIGMKR